MLKARWRRPVSLAYGEILTAERSPGGRSLTLHTLTAQTFVIGLSQSKRLELEHHLRGCGVRIVDEYGAMITPTLDDFLGELARDPRHLRQSSDDA